MVDTAPASGLEDDLAKYSSYKPDAGSTSTGLEDDLAKYSSFKPEKTEAAPGLEDNLAKYSSFKKPTDQKAEEPGTLETYGQTLKEAAKQVPGYVAQAVEGQTPFSENTKADEVIDQAKKQQQQFEKAPGAEAPVLGGLAEAKDIREAAPSIGSSGAGLIPSVVGGVVGGALKGARGGIPGAVIGAITGGGLGYVGMKRAAENQLVRSYVDQEEQKRQAAGQPPLTDQEKLDLQNKALATGEVEKYGHGEAAPELAGQALETGLMMTPAGKIVKAAGSLVPKSALGKALGVGAAKVLGTEATEIGTEAATQQLQQPVESKLGMTDEPPRELTSPADWGKSIGEVAKPVAIATLPFAGLGGGVGVAQTYQEEKQKAISAAQEQDRAAIGTGDGVISKAAHAAVDAGITPNVAAVTGNAQGAEGVATQAADTAEIPGTQASETPNNETKAPESAQEAAPSEPKVPETETKAADGLPNHPSPSQEFKDSIAGADEATLSNLFRQNAATAEQKQAINEERQKRTIVTPQMLHDAKAVEHPTESDNDEIDTLRAKAQEAKHAQQEPSPSQNDGGSSAQPGIREEGGNTPVSGGGLQPSGQRNGDTEQESSETPTPQTLGIDNGESKNQTPEERSPEEGQEKPLTEAAQEVEANKAEVTPEQEQKGEYQKPKTVFNGIPIALENAAGSERSGTDASGKEWHQIMHDHYGEIEGTRGADGDKVDAFINPAVGDQNTEKHNKVFVVDQVDPKTGVFDEHKVVLGHGSLKEAKNAYLSNYEAGWKGLGAISPMTMPNFKKWLANPERHVRPVNSRVPTAKKAQPEQERRGNPELRLRYEIHKRKNTHPTRLAAELEMAKRELRTNPTTDIPNKRAFFEGKLTPFVASLDIDSLKYVNDTMGHAAGDDLLKTVAQVVAKHVDAYHVSGDELWAKGEDEAQLKAGLTAAMQELQSGQYKIESDNHTFTKPTFSFGVAPTSGIEGSKHHILAEALKRADLAMLGQKEEREKSGDRAGRGEMPKGMVEKSKGIVKPLKQKQPEHYDDFEAKRKPIADLIAAGKPVDAYFAALKAKMPLSFNLNQDGTVQITAGGFLSRSFLAEEGRQGRLNHQNMEQRFRKQNGIKDPISPAKKAFLEKQKAEAAQASRTEQKAKNPFASKEEALAHLHKEFGPGVRNLPLELTADKSTWPESIRNQIQGNEEAVYHNGKAYLDLSAIEQDRMAPVVLHEIGEHYGLNKMLGKREYDLLQSHIVALSQTPNSAAATQWERVEKLYPEVEPGSPQFIAEVIAKLGEKNPKLPWYRRLLSKIKSFLVDKGLGRGFIIGTMKESDLHELLKTSLRTAARGIQKDVVFGHPAMASKTSLPDMISIDGADKPTKNADGKPIANTEEAVRNFYKWFGNSKAVDQQGRPIVMYHGTDKTFEAFDLTKHGEKDHGWYGVGVYLTPDKAAASGYANYNDELVGQNIMPVYAKIEHPFKWAQKMRPTMDSAESEDVTKRLLAQGNDGVFAENVHASPDHAPMYETVVFNPDQVKSAVGNNGDFTQGTDEFMKSRTEPNAETVPETPTEKTWIDKLIHNFNKATDPVLSNWLALLSARHVVEVGAKVLPGLKKYAQGMSARQLVIDTHLRESDQITTPWHKLKPIVRQKLNTLMQDSTLDDVDASKDWRGVDELPAGTYPIVDAHGEQQTNGNPWFRAYTQTKLGKLGVDKLKDAATGAVHVDNTSAFFASEAEAQAFVETLHDIENEQLANRHTAALRSGFENTDDNPSREQAHAELQKRYAEVTAHNPEIGKIYKEAHGLLSKIFNLRLQALQDRIGEAIIDRAKRKELIAALRQQFESSSLTWYYAPLARFGKHWFYGRDSKGDGNYQMFESQKGRDQAAEDFTKRGGKVVGTGTSLNDLLDFNAQGANDNFVLQIKDLISDKALPEDVKNELSDEIYQLYLSTLPDVSMRHKSQHRKGTAGFELDQMRSFAHSVHHGLSQLANMREGRHMLDTLNQSKEALELAQFPATRQRQAQTEVDAAESLANRWNQIYANNSNLPSNQLFDLVRNDINAEITEAKDSDEAEDIAHRLNAEDALVGKFYGMEPADVSTAIARYEDKKAEVLELSKHIKPEDTRRAADLINELAKSYRAMVATQSSDMDQVAGTVRQLGFMMNLAFSLSSGVLNMLQTPGVAMPVVAGRHGFVDTLKAFKETSADFARAVAMAAQGQKDSDGNASITEVLQKRYDEATSNDEKANLQRRIDALEYFKASGDISRTQTFDTISIGQEGELNNGALRDFNKKLSWIFHHGERANREITLLAAFDLEFARTGDEMKALDYAREANNRAHGDYAPANAPRIFRGWPAAIALQFKKYSQMMLFLWGKAAADHLNGWQKLPEGPEREAARTASREAGKTLAGLFVMQGAFAGMMGMPLAGALTVVLNALGDALDDDDEPFDIWKEARTALTEMGGETFATAVCKGAINAFTPVNAADRMSLSDVIFKPPLQEMEGRDLATHYLAEMTGPGGGILVKLMQSASLIGDGEMFRAAEQAMPKVVADTLKAYRYSTEDARTMNGDLIKEMEPIEILLQMGGFSSSALEVAQTEKSYAKGAEKSIGEARQKLINNAVRAKEAGEPVDQDTITSWNARHPTWKIYTENISRSAQTKKENEKRRGDRGYAVNPKLAYMYEKFDLDESE